MNLIEFIKLTQEQIKIVDVIGSLILIILSLAFILLLYKRNKEEKNYVNIVLIFAFFFNYR